MQIKNCFKVKVLKDVTAIYCTDKNLLTFLGPKRVKSLKPAFKVILTGDNLGQTKQILVTSTPMSGMSRNKIKKMSERRGRVAATIKALMVEASQNFYRKLRFVGVGYRALLPYSVKRTWQSDNFTLKLGYSHMIHFILPSGVHGYCKKYVKLTLFGGVSYDSVSQTLFKIRSLKKPEPYKGKGILLSNEVVGLKVGKRV